MDRKDTFIIVRVTGELKEKVEKHADDEGMSLSQYVRASFEKLVS